MFLFLCQRCSHHAFRTLGLLTKAVLSALFSSVKRVVAGLCHIPVLGPAVALSHLVAWITVLYIVVWASLTAVNATFSFACSLPPISYWSLCPRTFSSPGGPSVTTDTPVIIIDGHRQAYEQALDDSAQGAFLAVEVLKAERLVAETLHSIQANPLPSALEAHLVDLLFPFIEEAKTLEELLEQLTADAENLLLR